MLHDDEHPETENASIPLCGKEGKPASAAALRAESDQGAAAAATSSGEYGGQVWLAPVGADPHTDEAWRPIGHLLAGEPVTVAVDPARDGSDVPVFATGGVVRRAPEYDDGHHWHADALTEPDRSHVIPTRFETGESTSFTMQADLPPEAAALFGLMAGSPTRDQDDRTRFAVTIDATTWVDAVPDRPTGPTGWWARMKWRLSGQARRDASRYAAELRAWRDAGCPLTKPLHRQVHVPSATVTTGDDH